MRFCWLIFFLFLATKANALDLTLDADSTGLANCCVKGKFHGRLVIEQFRWNRWVVMYSFGSNQHWTDTCLETKLMLHSGENQFRFTAVPTNPYVDLVNSGVTKVIDSSNESVCGFAMVCGPSDRITLKRMSYWEIHDQVGRTLKSGTSADIPVGDLPKGGYFLYYDNCISEFFRQ